MKFGYIAPTKSVSALNIAAGYDFHLVLAHLVQKDAEYVQAYLDCPKDSLVILDNSGFELYKQGLPMFEPDRLVDLGHRVKANVIVLPDYPGEASTKTQEAAEKYAPIFREAGFGTFYCPQAEIGDLAGLLDAFVWALTSPLVDYVGVSILAVPNAFDVEKTSQLQRYLARHEFMQRLNARLYEIGETSLYHVKKKYNKKIHFLGMVDGPNEIEIMSHLISQGIVIDTWDSSSPVWAGLNGIMYDESPTGLINGKFETHVDFAAAAPDLDGALRALTNMDYIQDQVDAYTNIVEDLEDALLATVPQEREDPVEAPVEFPFRYDEGDALNEVMAYIAGTYGQHYVADDANDNIQVVDIWKANGSLMTTSRDTAMKYLSRFGKKDGFNRKDLLKAIHYIVYMMHATRTK